MPITSAWIALRALPSKRAQLIDGILTDHYSRTNDIFWRYKPFPDKTIYWRVMREVATYFEQRPDLIDNSWQAIVLVAGSGR